MIITSLIKYLTGIIHTFNIRFLIKITIFGFKVLHF
jgi:hypothetical protein